MIIDCISDLHGHYPNLEGGDLLIVAGDLTARDRKEEYLVFFHWLQDQKYRKIVFIAGNHDNWMQKNQKEWLMICKSPEFEIIYLCDSGTEFTCYDPLEKEGQSEVKRKTYKIWGSPWSLWFDGINQSCTAFTGSENDLRKHYMMIPRDIDILITHCPPYGILDSVLRYSDDFNEHCGSRTLRELVLDGSYFPNLKLHIFGHIHEHGGKKIQTTLSTFINCSHVNERYQPVNKPIRVIL